MSTRRRWHLDLALKPTLFEQCWSVEAHQILLQLFRHVDKSERAVVSMLPPGISPGGLAAAAAVYFLPETSAPPKPHCRIAVFPGLHFVPQVEATSFDSKQFWEATRLARLAGSYARLEGPVGRLRLAFEEGVDVLFHWLMRSQRRWLRHWQPESKELVPRSQFGRKDPYHACLDFIESERLEAFSTPGDPYDLLVYCPYFHPKTVAPGDDELRKLVDEVEAFNAHRKLVIVRSPFDYWARRLEKFLPPGIGLSGFESNETQGGVGFVTVDQCLNLEEASILASALNDAARSPSVDRGSLNEARVILRRMLVSLDPDSSEDKASLQEVASRLEGLCAGFGIASNPQAWEIVQRLTSRFDSPTRFAKREKLLSLAKETVTEVWVTKDADRRVVLDAELKNQISMEPRLMNRWTAPGRRDSAKRVVLVRIDRESDLDVMAYLRSGDLLLMSAWEAVVRASTIMRSWERSEIWRERAHSVGIADGKSSSTRYADPLLDLANHLDTLIPSGGRMAQASRDENQESWWDRRETSTLEIALDRGALLHSTGAPTSKCVEVRFEGGHGMFVRTDDEVQVVRETGSGSEVAAVSVKSLRASMTMILFRDAERNSFFDILMEQLERSPAFQNDAKVVRGWKERLRGHVIEKGLRSKTIADQLAAAGGREFDLLTIRSWIYGSTMAPLKREHFTLLVSTLGLSDVESDSVFSSVEKLRVVARMLGKALNQLILSKKVEDLESHLRLALLEAGIDVEELAAAVDARVVDSVSTSLFDVEDRYIRRLFAI